MKTINKSYSRLSLSLLAILMPILSFASTPEQLAAEAKAIERNNMIMEGTCVAVFVGGVIAFLIWKTRHDKKMREQQMEQMKKIQAAKRRAA